MTLYSLESARTQGCGREEVVAPRLGEVEIVRRLSTYAERHSRSPAAAIIVVGPSGGERIVDVGDVSRSRASTPE